MDGSQTLMVALAPYTSCCPTAVYAIACCIIQENQLTVA
jgi:hypothetical protein